MRRRAYKIDIDRFVTEIDRAIDFLLAQYQVDDVLDLPVTERGDDEGGMHVYRGLVCVIDTGEIISGEVGQ